MVIITRNVILNLKVESFLLQVTSFIWEFTTIIFSSVAAKNLKKKKKSDSKAVLLANFIKRLSIVLLQLLAYSMNKAADLVISLNSFSDNFQFLKWLYYYPQWQYFRNNFQKNNAWSAICGVLKLKNFWPKYKSSLPFLLLIDKIHVLRKIVIFLWPKFNDVKGPDSP